MSQTDARGRGHPVLVRGRFDSEPSRGLWLVKWLLLIPHYILLAFLWLAFVVVTVIAFFAILFTGRYPHALFSFNLGVLRWSWRVMYYGYSALATDRYPPFSLGEEPDYPATLDVAYPQQLSRGLVLVKWWLLALPHYFVLAFLMGGATWGTQDFADGDDGFGTLPWSAWILMDGGLIGLLALIAAVVLLFTTRYPRGLFDLVMGLNRWVLRVTAYAALMTDTYPPFRLDQGGPEPADPVGPAPAAPGTATAAAVPVGAPAGAPVGVQAPPAAGPPTMSPGTGPAPTRSSAGPVIALVVGVLALLPGLALAGIGGAGLWLDSRRDAAGFVSTAPRTLSTPTAALTAEDVDLTIDRAVSTWATPDRFGTLRVRATSTDGSPLFVGVAPQSAVDGWLGTVAHDQVRNITGGEVRYLRRDGQASAAAPTDQQFWVASVTGSGPQTLTWPVQTGRWALVVAGADGAPGVQAQVDVGANIPSLTGVATGLLVAGVVVVLVAGALIALGAVGLGRRTAGPAGPAPAGPFGPPPAPRAAPTQEFRQPEQSGSGAPPPDRG